MVTPAAAILPLAAALDPAQAGGKAAALARALAGGLPVPPGLVLTRQALADFLSANRLGQQAAALLAGYAGQSLRARTEAYAGFCARVMAAPLPEGLRDATAAPLIALLAQSPHGLAVRSSGLSEDSRRASFAGVFQSFLGARSLQDFWRDARRCWCTAWAPAAWAYAAKMGLELPPDGMAVLVQPLIAAGGAAADTAGIIFTADPLTGDPWRFVVNSVFGLAAGLAEGSAPADRFVLAWDSGDLLEARPARKPSALRIGEGGIRACELPAEQQVQPALTLEQARRVARMALAADRLFDCRLDVEWALAGDQLWLLQARPLTALPPFFPHELPPEEAAQTWTPYLNTWGNLNPREKLVAPFARDRWTSELWSRFLVAGDIFPHGHFLERDFHGYRYATERRWGSGDALAETDAEKAVRIEAWLGQHEARLRQNWLDQLERARQANRRADSALASARQPLEWLPALLDFVRAERDMQAHVWYAPQWLIFTCEFLLKAFLTEAGLDLPAEPTIAGLLQGLSCYSVERAAAAQALGQAVDEPVVREAFTQLPLSRVVPHLQQHHPACRFLRGLRNFCRDWGVEPPETDRSQVIGQDVDGVLLVIKNSLPGADLLPAGEMQARAAARRRAVEDEVRARLAPLRPDLLPRFERLLDWAQFWTPALDNRKWHTTMTVSLRMGALKSRTGESLQAAGLIDQPDHLLLLTMDDWQGFIDHPDPQALRCIYEQRKGEYERDRRLEPLPYLGKPPQPVQAAQGATQPEPPPAPASIGAPGGLLLRGEGLAPGKVRGRARVIANMDAERYADRLGAEDILVCGPESFSAEWRRDYYALFLVVRGMVAVQGAQLHHATQIARECGVPFVHLPAAALAQLPDGAEITIDGAAGTVEVG